MVVEERAEEVGKAEVVVVGEHLDGLLVYDVLPRQDVLYEKKKKIDIMIIQGRFLGS